MSDHTADTAVRENAAPSPHPEMRTALNGERPPKPSIFLTEEIGLLDLLLVAAAHRRVILRAVVIAVVIAAIISLFVPNSYTGEALILTPIQPVSLSSTIMGDLGGVLSNLNGAADTLGLKDPNDVYIAMLRSRTVADRIIKRFHLETYYKNSHYDDTLKDFAADSNISSGHDGTITIDYLHKDPKTAAAVANAYVEELEALSQEVAVTEAAQRRLFFSRQLEKSKDELANAEVDLRKAQETTGMLDLDKQATAIVTAIADVQGQIMAQEVLIKGLKSYGTPRNPDVNRAEQQLVAMRAQLADLERRNGGGNGDVLVGTGKLPAAGLEYMRKLRNVKYYEAVYEVLAKQYEAAVIDETTSGAVVQVVARAMPPDKKTGPKRGLLVLAVAIAAFLLSYAWAFTVELCRQWAEDPVSGPKMRFIGEMVRPQGGWRGLGNRAWGRVRHPRSGLTDIHGS